MHRQHTPHHARLRRLVVSASLSLPSPLQSPKFLPFFVYKEAAASEKPLLFSSSLPSRVSASNPIHQSMAQDDAPDSSSTTAASSSAPSAVRLNAAAPEFTPRSAAAAAAGHQHHPRRQHRVAYHHNQPQHPQQQHHHHYQPQYHHHQQHHHQQQWNHYGVEEEGDAAADGAEVLIPEDVAKRVVKQVEFYFSDVNLATTEHLMKFMVRDPEGFVPMSVVASFRKVRELVSERSSLAAVLQTSVELIVSDDGKKVRRRVPFTEADAEEVQSRIVVAENLREEHRYPNLMKIFSAFGSVKSIRTCYPQGGTDAAGTSSGRASKIEMLFANKVHAFVEYKTVEDAEKAVSEFSSGRSWRDGIRVRSLLGCLKQTMGQGRRGGDEVDAADEDDPETTNHPQDYETEDASQLSEAQPDHQADDGNLDKGGMRQGRGRGRGGRGRGRGQYHGHNRDASHPIGTPPSNHSALGDHPSKPPPGPRMPDGTRGFTMGRGKPLNPSNAA
uniref:HTH La-type RNA-binding domain-containing protein n=1 Tax=Leersia perrieri TaxID=77586 RepID=A0A0D9XAE4_9ORYZ